MADKADRLRPVNHQPEAKPPIAERLLSIVQVHAAKRTSYGKAQTFLEELAALAAAPVRSYVPPCFDYAPGRPLLSIARFHADFRYGGDLSRADFAYAIYAIAHGVSHSDIKAASSY